MLNSAISPFAACFVEKGCGPLWSTWGASLGEGKFGVKAGIVHTKLALPNFVRSSPPLQHESENNSLATPEQGLSWDVGEVSLAHTPGQMRTSLFPLV